MTKKAGKRACDKVSAAADPLAMRDQIGTLRAMLSEIGPPEKLTENHVRQCVVSAVSLLNECAEDAVPPDQQLMLLRSARRQILFAFEETKLWPALAASDKNNRGRAKGGNKTADRFKRKAAKDEAVLTAAAKKLRADNASLSNSDMARLLSDRGHGGAEAIRKKLPRLLRK